MEMYHAWATVEKRKDSQAQLQARDLKSTLNNQRGLPDEARAITAIIVKLADLAKAQLPGAAPLPTGGGR